MLINRVSERDQSVGINEFDEMEYINEMYAQSRKQSPYKIT